MKRVEVLGFIRKEQNHAEVAKIYGENESSVGKVVKKEKEIRGGSAVTPWTTKLRPQRMTSA